MNSIDAAHAVFRQPQHVSESGIDESFAGTCGTGPVFDLQLRHTLKLVCVVRHECEVQRSSMCCDEQIVGANQRTSPLQVGADLGIWSAASSAKSTASTYVSLPRFDLRDHRVCSANASPIRSASKAVFACAMFDVTAMTMPLSRAVISDITMPLASSPLTLPGFVASAKRTRSDGVE
jgi:hypothetical protein